MPMCPDTDVSPYRCGGATGWTYTERMSCGTMSDQFTGCASGNWGLTGQTTAGPSSPLCPHGEVVFPGENVGCSRFLRFVGGSLEPKAIFLEWSLPVSRYKRFSPFTRKFKMLVLSRKVGEKLVIGEDIVVTISKISGNRVTIAIDAPKDVAIRRGELAQRESSDDFPSGNSSASSLHVAAHHA